MESRLIDLPVISREQANNLVIGTGAAFPFRFSDSGGIKTVKSANGTEKINMSIKAILSTRRGERVNRPTFGSMLHTLVFEPNDDLLHPLLRRETEKALRDWEKRIRVVRVTMLNPSTLSITGLAENLDISPTIQNLQRDQSVIGIFIEYEIYRTHQPGSYVFPFVREAPSFDLNLKSVGIT